MARRRSPLADRLGHSGPPTHITATEAEMAELKVYRTPRYLTELAHHLTELGGSLILNRELLQIVLSATGRPAGDGVKVYPDYLAQELDVEVWALAHFLQDLQRKGHIHLEEQVTDRGTRFYVVHPTRNLLHLAVRFKKAEAERYQQFAQRQG